MKNAIGFFIFLFCSVLAFGQAKTTDNSAKIKEEEALNKRFDECQMALWNGTTSTMTLTSSSVSDSTDIKVQTMEVSENGIKCQGLEIKIGMSKAQVSNIAKKMGIDLSKRTSKYWLISNSGIIMIFQSDKLITMPGICMDFELTY